jgi:hypothetical protein
MAIRVVASEVRQIMDNCTLSDQVVDSFIVAGTEVITEVFEGDTEINTALLKEIERWFVAHMLASTLHRTTSEEKVGDASMKYTGKWEKNLESTPYGQVVLTLDVSGRMANVGKMRASIYAVKQFDE